MRLGLERSARAAQQAPDLQAMRGGAGTLPVLLSRQRRELQLLQLER